MNSPPEGGYRSTEEEGVKEEAALIQGEEHGSIRRLLQSGAVR
jgi:hypothetical protein